jgi:hypothetical protein
MADSVYALDENNKLTGEFTDVLDLRGTGLEPDIGFSFYKEPIDLSSPAPLNTPSVLIEDVSTVRELYLPADDIFFCYVAICRLPNLEELYIIGGDCIDYYLHWLDLIDLPSLKKVHLAGDFEWLRIVNAPMLTKLDLRKLKYIDMVYTTGTPALANVNVNGCPKIMSVGGMSEEAQEQLGITAQITKNQSVSRLDGEIYPDMTVMDIQHAFSCLNAEAHKEGKLSVLYKKIYGCRLLKPLECNDAHGTGMVYPYSYEDGVYTGASGESTPEACLREAKEDLEFRL